MKRPCKNCPFRKSVEPGYTGGADPTVFIGQAAGPFMMPCHAGPGYDPDAPAEELAKMLPCEGSRVFRANCGIREELSPALQERFSSLIGEQSDEVFGSPAELLAHHERITLPMAEFFLRQVTPVQLAEIELRKSGVRFVKRKV